jgi:hypothetical protein
MCGWRLLCTALALHAWLALRELLRPLGAYQTNQQHKQPRQTTPSFAPPQVASLNQDAAAIRSRLRQLQVPAWLG